MEETDIIESGIKGAVSGAVEPVINGITKYIDYPTNELTGIFGDTIREIRIRNFDKIRRKTEQI